MNQTEETFNYSFEKPSGIALIDKAGKYDITVSKHDIDIKDGKKILVLKCDTEEGTCVFDRTELNNPKFKWKLMAIWVALDIIPESTPEGTNVVLNPKDLIGKEGSVLVRMREYVNKEGKTRSVPEVRMWQKKEYPASQSGIVGRDEPDYN